MHGEDIQVLSLKMLCSLYRWAEEFKVCDVFCRYVRERRYIQVRRRQASSQETSRPETCLAGNLAALLDSGLSIAQQ